MKAVAVPYIIAILLGVGVIGLVGYWLFVSGGQFGGGAAAQQCRSDFLQACQQWAASGYTAEQPSNNGVFQHSDGNACLKQVTGKSTADDATKDVYRSSCTIAGS
ncbi:MAG: hypothetical protein HYS62_01190 [Candidatus Aenigmarchaeota archaeon]|nr:hypothetical protein [Candidatus Aenigmarchaeota archaeon]